jgi:hypothetical protein
MEGHATVMAAACQRGKAVRQRNLCQPGQHHAFANSSVIRAFSSNTLPV